MGFIENLAQSAGGQVASGAIDAGLGLIMEHHNDKRQIRQQQKLTDIQTEAQRNLSQYNQDLAYQMWEKTNLGAQKKLAESIGMNSAMLYGGGAGPGGSTTMTPGSVSGGQAAQAPQTTAHGDAGMGLQVGMMTAQKQLLEAQARNLDANTAKTSGVDTENVGMQTQSLAQQITNAKVAEQVQRLELKFQGETYEDRVDQILYTAKNAMFAQEMAERSNYIQKATRDEQVDIIRRAATEALLRNGLTEAQTKEIGSKIQVNEAQIKTWSTQLTQGWENLDKTEKQIRIQAFKAEIEAKQPGLFNVIGGVLSGALDEISDLTTGRDSKYRQDKKVNLQTK